MTRLLDTNICIAWLKRDRAVRDRLVSAPRRSLAICSVVKGELLFGARKSSRVAENLALLSLFTAELESWPFDDAAAEHYALLRAQAEVVRQPIGPHDLFIASIALSRDATLVTRNDREFRRIVGLRVEVW